MLFVDHSRQWLCRLLRLLCRAKVGLLQRAASRCTVAAHRRCRPRPSLSAVHSWREGTLHFQRELRRSLESRDRRECARRTRHLRLPYGGLLGPTGRVRLPNDKGLPRHPRDGRCGIRSGAAGGQDGRRSDEGAGRRDRLQRCDMARPFRRRRHILLRLLSSLRSGTRPTGPCAAGRPHLRERRCLLRRHGRSGRRRALRTRRQERHVAGRILPSLRPLKTERTASPSHPPPPSPPPQ